MNYTSPNCLKGTATESILPRSQVAEQVDAINAASNALEDVVMRIENRIGCVLRPELKQEGCKSPDSAPIQAVVPLADHIRDITSSINRSYSRLESILSRVEL